VFFFASLMIPLSAGAQTISGFVRDLDGNPLSAARAAQLQRGTANFDVTVTAQVVGANDAVIANVTGFYRADSGGYIVVVDPPAARGNRRIDITLSPNSTGFQQVSLQRVALRNQSLDVVMPLRKTPTCSNCYRKRFHCWRCR
jgi:hypothetical protein